MRIIDADRLIEDFWTDIENGNQLGYGDTEELIKNAPTLDPAQLVPQGEWKLNENHKWACTNCDGLAVEHPDEPDKWQALTACCPNCGARMRKEAAQ